MQNGALTIRKKVLNVGYFLPNLTLVVTLSISDKNKFFTSLKKHTLSRPAAHINS